MIAAATADNIVVDALDGKSVGTAFAPRQQRLSSRKLWIAFVLQIAAISVATLLSVYGSWVVLRDVLVQRALADETTHYWNRDARTPGAELPDHRCLAICKVSSRRSNRSAKGGKGKPRPTASRSCQAAPMPRLARPPESTSSVLTCLTRKAGCR